MRLDEIAAAVERLEALDAPAAAALFREAGCAVSVMPAQRMVADGDAELLHGPALLVEIGDDWLLLCPPLQQGARWLVSGGLLYPGDAMPLSALLGLLFGWLSRGRG